MLLAFQGGAGAFWECRLDFTDQDYANVSFFDHTGEDILFHLSFRPAEQLVAVNRMIGGAWDTEETFACALAGGDTPVRLDFGEDAVSVSVDGAPILDRDLGPDLGSITLFDRHGGAVGIRIGGGANSDRTNVGQLELSDRFMVTGWAFDLGAPAWKTELRVAPTGSEVPHLAQDAAEIAMAAGLARTDIGLTAVLPGVAWRGIPEDQPLGLELVCNGHVSATLEVMDRDELARQVEQIAETATDTDAFALVSAVEHVVFAGIADRLSPAARDRLGRAIVAYNLFDLATPEQIGAAPADPAAAHQAWQIEELAGVEAAQKAFSTRLRATPGATPADILATMGEGFGAGLPDDLVRLLVLRLADPFCEADQLDALYPLAERVGLLATGPSHALWEGSFRLPFAYLAGDRASVVDFFQRLGCRPNGWISTPALSWTLRRLLADLPPWLSETEREAIFRAFLDYVDWSSGDMFSQVNCRHVIATLADLLGPAHLFPPRFVDWMVERVIRSHWMSPTLWDALDGLASDSPTLSDPRLRAARKSFETLRDAVESEAGLAGWTGTPPPVANERDRCLRELAAAGWTGDEGLCLDPRISRELALRRRALPGGAPQPDALAAQTAAAIREASPAIPRSPLRDHQERVSRRLADLLALLPSVGDAETAKRIDALWPDLRALGGQRGGFLGLANALSLTNAMLRDGAEASAAAAETLLRSLTAALSDHERHAMSASPAVRMALFGLRQTAESLSRELPADLFDTFPTALEAIPAANAEAERGVPRDGRAAFYDTIVLIFSCKPLLETRIAAMRETWLNDLRAMGIPYLIVVGDGDDSVADDVLHLDAPDDYEGLPRKVLNAIRWTCTNTAFSHMLKIDDDCFLDAERFFHGQSYRKFAYFGRRLHRTAGQTDRTWHLTRQGVDALKAGLDKSPEPSTYAEGGTGYVLNRTIMEILLRNAETPAGHRLILSSIMEDKLVGDLLGLDGILPDGEDFDACVLRRSRSGGRPVSRWENAFLPSAASPAMIAHLDSAELHPVAAAQARTTGLLPKKVWPSHAPARIGWNTNAVELLSPEDHLARINAEPLAVVACLHNEAEMLPHFLAHYRSLGVRGFLMVDNCSDDGTLEILLEQPDVAVFSADTDYSAAAHGVAWQQAVLSHFRVGRWSLVADIDELLLLKPGETDLPALLSGPDVAHSDAVRVFMLDFYPEGPLSDASFAGASPFDVADHVDRDPFLADSAATGPFSNSPTWTSSLRHRLLPGSRSELFVAQKLALLKYKPWMHLTAGLHYVAEARVAEREMVFAHFKYHGDFHQKVAAEARRGQHFNNSEEYRRYRALLAEGREVLYDPAVSVHWQECDWLREKLG